MPYGFKQEDLSMFSPISAYIKHVTSEAGPFLAQGA